MRDSTEDEYLTKRAQNFAEMRKPPLTAGALLLELQTIIAEHGPDVPVFSLADSEWADSVYWEPFEYEDGSGVNDWHGLSVTIE